MKWQKVEIADDSYVRGCCLIYYKIAILILRKAWLSQADNAQDAGQKAFFGNLHRDIGRGDYIKLFHKPIFGKNFGKACFFALCHGGWGGFWQMQDYIEFFPAADRQNDILGGREVRAVQAFQNLTRGRYFFSKLHFQSRNRAAFGGRSNRRAR